LKDKCCLYVIIPIRLFSIKICNLLIDLLSYLGHAVRFSYKNIAQPAILAFLLEVDFGIYSLLYR